MDKDAIDIKDVLNENGEFVRCFFMGFEPVPLLPTYSFIKEGKEVRYLLKKTKNDKKFPFYLELASPIA